MLLFARANRIQMHSQELNKTTKNIKKCQQRTDLPVEVGTAGLFKPQMLAGGMGR